MGLMDRVKKTGMSIMYDYLDKDPDRNLPKIMDWVDQFAGKDVFAAARKQARKVIEDPDNNWYRLIKSLWTDIDDGVRKTLFENFIVNSALIGFPKECDNREKYGCNIPWAILMDPTSACNLHCTGCWAAEYGNKMNMDLDTMDSIIRQGTELGTYMYLYTGGEPLVRKKDIITLCERHPDCVFMSFTNATLIDEAFADEMLRVKNFVPAISVEGFEEATDSRRGHGTFQAVMRAMEILKRKKLPFGVCQVGKSFRNEITPGNFIFRIREFEQMELEFFCQPGTDLEWFRFWREYCHQWLLSLHIQDENLRLRDHEPEELAFYSKATTDFEFLFPFGWGELWGVADRTDYDLKQHQEHSGKDLTYFDQEKNEHYIPYVIEPSLGADRVTLAFLVEAYDEEVVDAEKNDVRTVMRFHPALAPFKCAVLPLSKKLGDKALEIRDLLARDFMVDYDDAGSIGKRYRRQDEIGTPLCVTVDFQTVGDDKAPADGCVTVRDRDTMEQVRMPIGELKAYIAQKIAF